MFSLKRYDLGEVSEVEVGWIGRKARRGRTKPPSPEQIKKWNRRQRVKKYRRLIEANFGEGDNWVCFKYRRGTRKPLKEVKSDMTRCLRMIRQIYRQAGHPFKFIYRLEYGKNAGAHIHMICNCLPGVNNIQALQTAWLNAIRNEERTHGAVDVESLSGSGGYDKLAEYICKDPASDEGGQMILPIDGIEEKKALVTMHASRNLIRPEPEKQVITKATVIRLLKEGPKPSPGYAVIKGSVHVGQNPVTGMPYICWKERRLKIEKKKPEKQEKPLISKAKGILGRLFRRLHEI